MAICLSHETALDYLRCPWARALHLPGRGVPAPATPERGVVPGLRSPVPETARKLLSRYAPFLRAPVHALVHDDASRRASEFVHPHVFADALPRRLCVRVEDDAFATGPELTLAQLANELDALDVVELAYEFCGTYAKGADRGSDCAYNLEPLTNVRRLERRLATMRCGSRRVRGARAVEAALRYALDGSASPRETHQAMLATLPRRLGGYGLGHPRLNFRVDVKDCARDLTDKRFYVCDMFWPEARLDVEYDSDKFHADAGKIARDAMRRNALAAMDITVITVTNSQMRNAEEFDRVARTIARRLGRPVPRETTEFRRARADLRTRLLGNSGFAGKNALVE